MNAKKNVLLAHTNHDLSISLSEQLSAMDCTVHTVLPSEDDRIVYAIKKLHCGIVDLDIPRGGGIRLIRKIRKVHSNARIIAIVRTPTHPLSMRLHMLGVYDVLERPLKKAAFTKVIQTALNDCGTMFNATAVPSAVCPVGNKPALLIADNDKELFQRLSETGIARDYAIDIAANEEDFILKARMGYYTIIFTSDSFIHSIMTVEDLSGIFCDVVKPVLCILSARKKESFEGEFRKFSFVECLPLHPTREEILFALTEILPKYNEYSTMANTSNFRVKIQKKMMIYVWYLLRVSCYYFHRMKLYF